MFFVLTGLFITLVLLVAFFVFLIDVPPFLYSHDYGKVCQITKQALFSGNAEKWQLADIFDKCHEIEENVKDLSITKEINISELVLLTVVHTISNSHLKKAPINHELLFIKLKHIRLYSSLYLRNIHEKL